MSLSPRERADRVRDAVRRAGYRANPEQTDIWRPARDAADLLPPGAVILTAEEVTKIQLGCTGSFSDADRQKVWRSEALALLDPREPA